MSVKVECYVNGPLENNSYLIVKDSIALIVDPSGDCSELLRSVATRELDMRAVVLTHGHFDHIMGLDQVAASFPSVPVYIHALDLQMLKDPNLNGSYMLGRAYSYEGPTLELAEGEIEIEGLKASVLHVPGHSPGGCALLFGDQCVSGDVLFHGSIGRSDLPGGDGPLLIKSIRQKLLSLPGQTKIFPGHGPDTTVGYENSHNMWFQ